jgi:hypothetical protein
MHYYVVAMIPITDLLSVDYDAKSDFSRIEVQDRVDEVLEPYYAGKKVEEHEEECYCRESRIWKKSQEAANEECGSIDDLKASFKLVVAADSELVAAEEDDTDPRNYAIVQKAWLKHIGPHCKSQRRHYLRLKDDKRIKPNRDCEDCHGTGFYKTTCNPDGHWDWFQIGGRWTGTLSDGQYDPRDDPDNTELCSVCGGTGLRVDIIGLKARAEDPEYCCNGCDGEGHALKWPTDWSDHAGDITTGHHFMYLIRQDAARIPYAIITPDGKWTSKESGAYGGVFSKEDKEWNKEARTLIENHANGTIAVVVDCHN